MAFLLRLGNANWSPPVPLPAFKAPGDPCLWENKCGWCGEKFMTAGELVAHVTKERES